MLSPFSDEENEDDSAFWSESELIDDSSIFCVMIFVSKIDRIQDLWLGSKKNLKLNDMS